MRKIFFVILYLLLISPLNAKTEVDKAFRKRNSSELDKKASFTLYSPDIYQNQQIREEQVFNNFGCDGQNVSPRLVWRNAPNNVKSFAITMFNKDAKTGSGWWHWIVYNIPANINKIDEGASTNKKLLPKGAIQGINDYGKKQYGGACPPEREKHNYIITIYALNVEKLDLPRNSTPAMVSLYLNKHKIKIATINAFYERHGESRQNLIKEDKKYKLNKGASSIKKNNIVNKNSNIKKISKENVVIEE